MRARRAGLRFLHRHRPPDPETPRRIQVARQMAAEGREIEAVAERLDIKVPVVCAMLGGGGTST
jgi:ribosomal protein S12 methylthiotransferase accessory factor YcaO